MGRLGVGCELRMARSWNSFEIEGEPALCPLYVGACGLLREKISLHLTRLVCLFSISQCSTLAEVHWPRTNRKLVWASKIKKTLAMGYL